MLRVLWRTLLLLVLSAILLGFMAAYVKLTQHQPHPDAALDVSITKDILWPWQETELRVHYSGKEGDVVMAPSPPSTDLVFLLDTSGSMSNADVETAKHELLRFPRDLGHNNRIAVVEFADSARVLVPFTRDYEALRNTLASMSRGAGGGTRYLTGLQKVLELLQGQPTSTVVMLTDGGANEPPAELRHFYESVWRPSGHGLFLVGIGTGGVDPTSFLQLTDEPDHFIVRGLDRTAIGELFAEVRERLGNVLGRNAQLRLPLAAPLWHRSQQAPSQSDGELQPLPQHTSEANVYALGTLFHRAYVWTALITPKFGGILTTLAEPVTLSYLSVNASDQSLERRALRTSGAAPKVLAVTPWFLFFLLLPAVLYLLAALLEWWLRRPAAMPAWSPVEPVKTYRPLPDLPRRFPPARQQVHWAPSLVLGLGGSGRHVLTHVRQVLNDSLDEPLTRPVLLALDVARDEVEGPSPEQVPGCLEPLDREQVFLLPPESCALYDAVHQQRTPDDPVAALDLREYRHLGVDALRLNKGSQRRAPLARQALLNDLAAGPDSALLQRLQEALTAWRSLAPEQHYRQIILVANVHGGVGSGWLSDLLVLLRRLIKTDEAQGKAVEISVLLLGEDTPQREKVVPLRAPTLFAELDRLASAGRQGFRHCLSAHPGAAKELLDGWVNRRPQDTVFVLSGTREQAITHTYPAAADAVGLLLEQRRRTALTQGLQGLQAVENQRRAREGREFYTQLAIHNAVFPRSFARQLMANRLGYLLAGEQILFPGLEAVNGQPQLQERAVHAASLLGQIADSTGEHLLTPGSAEQSILDDLRTAALGDSTRITARRPGVDELRHAAHGLRLLLLDNANRLFVEERQLGLAGLLQATRGYARHLQGLGQETVQELAEDCHALANQAACWIELFLGTAVLQELERQARAADAETRYGFIQECVRTFENDLKTLQEWQRGNSRMLLGPLAGMELQDTATCARHLDRHLRDTFLPLWLGAAEASVEALAARCYWEVTMPGLNGDRLGISLVLRGSQPRHYGPEAGELRRFQADLHREVASVLDAETDFHILKLLQDRLDPTDPHSLVRFIEGLKGGLKGERSTLLLSLPLAAGLDARELQALRLALQGAFEKDSAGAAELLYTYDDKDRYRMSMLQLLPLLTPAPQLELAQPLHRYERLRRDYARRLAEALGLQSVQLPPVAGIALQDEARLRQFARLYAAGRVLRRELDNVWHVHDGQHWHPMTLLPEQTLADAAAYFVTHKDLNATADEVVLQGPLASAQEDEDFPALLEWLLTTRSGG